MYVYTENDYKILAKITDKEFKCGLSKSTGLSIKDLVDRTGLSDKKVRISIKRFLEDGLVGYGVSKGNTKTYYLLEKGLEEMTSINIKSGQE